MKIAAIRSFPYEIFDSSNQLVASRETSTVAEALIPGAYRVVVHALGQTLTENVTVMADQDTVLAVVLKGDQFAIVRIAPQNTNRSASCTIRGDPSGMTVPNASLIWLPAGSNRAAEFTLCHVGWLNRL